jgi:redox-sensitive bicupin YhaK (pirin superfamily)
VRATVLEPGRSIAFANLPTRHVWLQVARGSLSANGVALRAGDGLSTSAAGALDLVAGGDGAEALLFDLA